MLLALPLAAADVENWNGVEAELVNTKRWIVRARAERRSADTFRQVLQVRAIGDVRFAVNPRITLLSLIHVVERSEGTEWERSNRLMGGFEVPFRSEHRTVTARTLVERNWIPGGPLYHRYRERVSWRWTHARLRPQLQVEMMVDREGWAVGRPTFSVLIPVAKHLELDMGYHFEFRPERLGGNRQMIYTYFLPDPEEAALKLG